MTSIINCTTQDESVIFDQVANLYESVGFGSSSFYVDDREFKKAFFGPGTYRCFAFANDGELIGMARVFSDNKICSWVAELCVHPKWRNQGVANKLLNLIVERSGHTAIYVDALSGTEGLYAKLGIKPKKSLVACSRAGKPKDLSSDSKCLTNTFPGEKC